MTAPCGCPETPDELRAALGDVPSFLDELRDANVRRCPDFKAGDIMAWSPAERGNELAGEVGELCNELKKLLRFDRQYGITMVSPTVAHFDAYRAAEYGHTVQQISQARAAIMQRVRMELGDAVVCLSLIATQLGFDIEPATREKFNATSDKIGSAVRL